MCSIVSTLKRDLDVDAERILGPAVCFTRQLYDEGFAHVRNGYSSQVLIRGSCLLTKLIEVDVEGTCLPQLVGQLIEHPIRVDDRVSTNLCYIAYENTWVVDLE